MSGERQAYEKKSLRKVVGNSADFDDIASECVGFANARGGHLRIGIEDGDALPPADQRIDDALVEQIQKRIPQLTHNVVTATHKVQAENGGEYIDVEIFSTTIASMSNGRYFLRVSDECRPLLPDELSRLMNDKGSFVWETQTSQQVPHNRYDEAKRRQFIEMVRASDRVSDFVKGKADDEILAHYLFVKDGYLTNLGVLWIGIRADRATLNYAPAIQFIKYDERELKVKKLTWDDYYLNPYELIEAVWKQVPEWAESYELPDGMFRKNVPHYRERIVRELLANALVHRPYTQRGDIFLNLFTDRLEVHNPGLLPLGVTPRNILHASVARNSHLAQVFRDLKLMEKEGSGYDTMYDLLLSDGKAIPEVVEGGDRVTVTVRKQIINPVIVNFVAKADETFQLTQRERVTLGLLAQHESLTAQQMCKLLELKQVEELQYWLGRLPDWELIKKKGRTRATEYFIDPELLRKLDFKGGTTLKRIESHRLQELILKDLEIYKSAGIDEIHSRIGKEIPLRRVQYEIHQLLRLEKIGKTGYGRWTRYLYTQKVPEKTL